LGINALKYNPGRANNVAIGYNAGPTGVTVFSNTIFIGANARINECELESFAYIGMGSSVGKGSVVESFAVLAAGADLPENSVVPSG
jgi:carbonic anhydrase/acetyltransferase-like protein (isoleucine patch superfamily)